ncbi:MAG: thiamine pyrophosphate-binding protein [Desulfotomaculaceae bacterium]
MRVADYIFDYFTTKGINTVFMVSGGQAMFLVDAVGRNQKIELICTHHEQTAGMSAEAYARITGKPSVALVTAGPGCVNVINGVVGAWTDSAPIIVVSGQSALSYVEYQQNHPIRQFGIQGINIKPLVEKVTKYFVTVNDPAKILYYLGRAYHEATTGRPGPVWLDVPLDVQKMEVPERLLEEFVPERWTFDDQLLSDQVKNTFKLISQAKRPIILAGQGVRLAGSVAEFVKLSEALNIPVLTARLGIDLINSDHRLYVGRPGNYGERAANFAVQNADLILVVGCRLASALVGHNPGDFGRNAKKVYVEIDQEELNKPGISDLALKINDDAGRFLKEMAAQRAAFRAPDFSEWVKKCQHWKEKYPVVQASYREERPVNSYYFTDKLSEAATPEDLVLVDTGSCFHVACQTWRIKPGQRFLTTGGLSSMGYWVAAIGACLANNKKRTICITGDGSLQMNIQEFATIKHNNLPIKVIIFNNNGYLLIRQTQKNLMEGHLVGEGPDTGVWCPDSLKIAAAYGIKGVRIDSVDGLEAKLAEVMDYDGPVICDVMTPEWQLIIPRTSSEKLPDGTLVAKAYEDMFPFLDRQEFLSEMIIKPEPGR